MVIISPMSGPYDVSADLQLGVKLQNGQAFHKLGWLALVMCGTFVMSTAKATTYVAPIGAQAFSLGANRIICQVQPNTTNEVGWRIEAHGRRLRPPPSGHPASVGLKLGSVANGCEGPQEDATAIAIAHWPVIDPASIALDVEAGRVDISGSNLTDVAMSWQSGGRQGTDTCHEPQKGQTSETCAFSLPREASADPQASVFTFLPSVVAKAVDVIAFDTTAHVINPKRFEHLPAKVIVGELLPQDSGLDTEANRARLPLRHSEAIGSVHCLEAECELIDGQLAVHNERGTDAFLDVRFVMRPHVFVRMGKQLSATPQWSLPLQRCPIALMSPSPLRAINNQRLVIKIGGQCKDQDDLVYRINGLPAHIDKTLGDKEMTWVVLHSDGTLGDDVQLTVERTRAVVGALRTKTRLAPLMHAQVQLPGYGAVDFIPSNRDAQMILPRLGDRSVVVPLAQLGAYRVTGSFGGIDLNAGPDPEASAPSVQGGQALVNVIQTPFRGRPAEHALGPQSANTTQPAVAPGFRIRGLEGATGFVALRLAVRDPSLPEALRDTNLAEFVDTLERSIRPANIPIALGATSVVDKPVVELVCAGADARPKRILPAHPTQIPYRSKDSCHLVLHRELLKAEEGEQILRVTINVAALDGINRPELARDERVVLRPGLEPRYMFIAGVVAPFDRVVVRATVIAEDAHYATALDGTDERVISPQVQWSLTVGDDHFRMYATTALPTGLFRVADKNHSGLLGLNAGILLRLVGLTRDGLQAPIAAELGFMVLSITGDSTPSPAGDVAAVGGLAFSVPIANVSRTTQANISLHAWAEYEMSRVFEARASGQAWGFIFGPSLSFGDVGLNL